MNYRQWLVFACSQLQIAQPNENSKIDALVLLQKVTGKSTAYLFAFDDEMLSEKMQAELTALLNRRLQGEPIAYILGEKEFWSLPLAVSQDTLIPRPDTEILVEKAVEIALERLEKMAVSAQKSGQHSSDFRLLDLGTGTGAIALALASELQPVADKFNIDLQIIGVDLIPNAVALAKQNAERNQLNVTFLQSRWFENVQGQFDLIVSNPPYIDEGDPHLAKGDVRFEPLSALVAEEQGYADLRHIIEQAPAFLRPQASLLLEHGWQQGQKVRSIFMENAWQDIQTLKDYGGNERVTMAVFTSQ